MSRTREGSARREVIDFFADKFSNLGLYTYLSRSLQQLHREANNTALAMAPLAEHAYRFERPGDTTVCRGRGVERVALRTGGRTVDPRPPEHGEALRRAICHSNGRTRSAGGAWSCRRSSGPSTTINDVILNISYTAGEDAALRRDV